MTEPSSVGSNEPQASHKWQELFNSHLNILKEHLKIWTSIQVGEMLGSKGHNVAQECVNQTQEMIHHFDRLSTSTVGSSHQQQPNDKAESLAKDAEGVPETAPDMTNDQNESLSLRPSKKRRKDDDTPDSDPGPSRATVQDYSGLFTIDSNPTPIEQLLLNLNRNDESRSSKRAKASKPAATRLPIGLSATTEMLQQSVNGHTTKISTTAISTNTAIEADHDSFLAKVNKRHQEKEEKRKKKSDKKRKRESNTSVEAADVEGLLRSERRSLKKRKQENVGGGDEMPDTKDKAPPPSNKKAKLKRSKSAGKERSKRQKKG